jgi:YbgC/YbaW family acyl-CoA thioester hydrolase
MSDHQKFFYNFKVRAHHLDMFGHVNNAVYLHLYEEARWDFIERNDYGISRIMQIKKGPVILEANVKFRKEILNREDITIVSQLLGKKAKIMQIEQMMLNQGEQICSQAIFTVAFFDLEQRKMIDPTDDWLEACGYNFAVK